jgi:hypothetical protein
MYDRSEGQYINRGPAATAAMPTDPGTPGGASAALLAVADACRKMEAKTEDLAKEVAELVKKMGDNSFPVRQKASEDLIKLAKGRERQVLDILKSKMIKDISDPDLEIRRRVDKAIEQLTPPPPPPPPPGEGKGPGKGGVPGGGGKGPGAPGGPPPGGGKGPGKGPPPGEIFA